MHLGRIFGIVVLIYAVSTVTFTITKSFEISKRACEIILYTESFVNFTISYILLVFFINIMIKSNIDRYFKLFDTIQNTDNDVTDHADSNSTKSRPNEIDINSITSHKYGYFLFVKHLISEFAVENLLFLTEVELFKQKFKPKCVENIRNAKLHKQPTLSFGSILKLRETDIAENLSDATSFELNLSSQSTLDSLNQYAEHVKNYFDPVATLTTNFDSKYDNINHENAHDSKQSNQIDIDETIALPKRKYLPETPIMAQQTFTATVAMMIDIFISKNAPHEINVSSGHRKKFLKQPTVQSVLDDTFNQSALQIKDLLIFDVYEKEAHKFINDSFKRFSTTSAFHKLSRRLQRKHNIPHFSTGSGY